MKKLFILLALFLGITGCSNDDRDIKSLQEQITQIIEDADKLEQSYTNHLRNNHDDGLNVAKGVIVSIAYPDGEDDDEFIILEIAQNEYIYAVNYHNIELSLGETIYLIYNFEYEQFYIIKE